MLAVLLHKMHPALQFDGPAAAVAHPAVTADWGSGCHAAGQLSR